MFVKFKRLVLIVPFIYSGYLYANDVSPHEYKIEKIYKEIMQGNNTSLTQLQLLAKTNDPQALVTLGFIYEHGVANEYEVTVEADLEKALSYYSQACNLGGEYGCYNASYFYQYGKRVKQSSELAEQYAKRMKVSDLSVSEHLIKDTIEKVWSLKNKAEADKTHRPEFLHFVSRSLNQATDSDLIFWQRIGFGKSEIFKLAMQWAQDCDPQITYMVARFYLEGYSILDDRHSLETKQEALQWFRWTAEHGYAPAQFALGSAWETGSAGLKVDRKEAKKWYQLAANQKNKDALLALGKIYYSGLDGKVDYTKALSLFEQAEHEGAAKGALWLSWMYYNGLGSPVDCNKARSFYEKGAGLNDQKISKNEYIDHCQSDQRSRESSVDTLPELTIDHYGSFDAGSDERPKICDQSFKINANKITNMSSLRLTLELENNEGITKEYVVPVPPFSLNTLGIDMNNNPINNMQTHIDIPVYEQNLCAFYDLTFKVKSATAMLNGKQHDLLKEGYIQPQDK